MKSKMNSVLWVFIIEALALGFCVPFLVKNNAVFPLAAILIIFFLRIHVNAFSNLSTMTTVAKFYAAVIGKLEKSYNIPRWHVNKLIDEAEKETLG